MNSCIYSGYVRHRRFTPVKNQFRYRVFQMYLDLAELPTLFEPFIGWSASRPALAWFRRADHLGSASESLDESVRNEVQRQTGFRPDGPIRLLTNLRYFGFSMNPVSFYYCFDSSGNRLTAVLAEVNNTPWGERHCYVLSDPCRSHSGTPGTLWTRKQFHVSPFMPMQLNYRWRLSIPGERLLVNIQNHEEDHGSDSTVARRPFDVTMSYRRTPITSASLTSVLLRHPCMTLKVFSSIYWQAFRLWSKGVPFVPHPDHQGHSENHERPEISNRTETPLDTPAEVVGVGHNNGHSQ